MIKLIKVIPLPDHQLELHFDDGVSGKISVQLPQHIFDLIKEPEVFNAVSV